ncbi:MAG: epoxyqueuosine reductase QueH, partial [[Clostridium] leptum]
MKENYERWMNREIQRFQARGEVPRLLLHSCCAPCSSAVLESVFRYFEITVFYYNPNIFPKEEYLHRVQEQKRFLAQFPPASSVTFLEGDYQPERFFQLAQGLE